MRAISRRRAVVALSAFATVLVVAAPAAAGPPVPVDADPVILTADETTCGFGIEERLTGMLGQASSPVREIFTAPGLRITVTNTDADLSRTYAITGPIFVPELAADEEYVDFGVGRSYWNRLEEDGRLTPVLVIGPTRWSLAGPVGDEYWVAESLPGGRMIDLCAELSGGRPGRR